jgi:rod shape-determining protein MreC
MLLLTDVSSRIPVLVDRTDARAMLSGDGSGNPKLEFVRGVGAVQAGDRILTSGDGGGLPRGLPIGVAARGIDGSWRVKLFSDRGAIDYVRVLLFQDFGQLVAPDALNAAPLAGLTTAPAPTADAAAAIGDAVTRRERASDAASQTAGTGE